VARTFATPSGVALHVCLGTDRTMRDGRSEVGFLVVVFAGGGARRGRIVDAVAGVVRRRAITSAGRTRGGGADQGAVLLSPRHQIKTARACAVGEVLLASARLLVLPGTALLQRRRATFHSRRRFAIFSPTFLDVHGSASVLLVGAVGATHVVLEAGDGVRGRCDYFSTSTSPRYNPVTRRRRSEWLTFVVPAVAEVLVVAKMKY